MFHEGWNSFVRTHTHVYRACTTWSTHTTHSYWVARVRMHARSKGFETVTPDSREGHGHGWHSVVSKGSTSSGLVEASLWQQSFFANIYQVPTLYQALCSVLHAKGAEMSNRHACCQSSRSPGGRGHYYKVSFKGSMGVRSVEALPLSPAPTRPEWPSLQARRVLSPNTMSPTFIHPVSAQVGRVGDGAEHDGAILVPHTSGAASSVGEKRPHSELEWFKGQPLWLIYRIPFKWLLISGRAEGLYLWCV